MLVQHEYSRFDKLNDRVSTSSTTAFRQNERIVVSTGSTTSTELVEVLNAQFELNGP